MVLYPIEQIALDPLFVCYIVHLLVDVAELVAAFAVEPIAAFAHFQAHVVH